jgi:hypothetical protein
MKHFSEDCPADTPPCDEDDEDDEDDDGNDDDDDTGVFVQYTPSFTRNQSSGLNSFNG